MFSRLFQCNPYWLGLSKLGHSIVLCGCFLFGLCNNAYANLLTAEEAAWVESYGKVSLAGETDWVPFDFVDEIGRFQGISWDYLQLVGEKTGLTFEVETGPWSENLAKLESRQVDLIPAINYTDERAKKMLYSSAYYNTLNYFFIRENLKEQAPVDLAGLRVAIPKGYATADYVRAYFPDVEIIAVESIEAAIDSVLNDDADLLYDAYVVLQYWLEQDGITAIKPFISARANSHDEVYFAVRQDLPILQSILNKGLAAITLDEHNAIIRRWLSKPLKNDFLMTKQERQWLAENPTITFTGDPNWLPYEAFDEQGDYLGIVAEYLSLIETKLNIKLQYVQTDTWTESVDLVKQGKIDVLSETTDSTLAQQLTFTEPYLSSPIVVVMNDEAIYVDDLAHIADKKIAMIHQYGYVETIKQAYPQINFLEVSSIQEGLTAVSTGKIDALIATLAQTSYHLSELGINNVHIVGQTPFQTQLAFGIKKDKPVLTRLFSRAIQSISPAEKQQILNRWGRFELKQQYDIVLIMQITIAVLVLVFALVFWNRKLAAEVTLRKQAEDQMKMIIDRIPLQVIISNLDGQVLVINPKVLEDYNVSAEQAKTFKVTDVYANQADRQGVLKELSDKGEVNQKLVDFRRFDGEIRTMMVSVMPIHYQRQQAFLSIAVDMTERVQLENDLVAAKVKAELASQSKSTFLANMSHEIRTPMNAIIGFTEILHEKITDNKLRSYVNTIQSAGNELLTLINDILDLSKVESGKVELSETSANLPRLFDELATIFRLSIEEKGLSLNLEVDPNLPTSLMLDIKRLRQILVNLVGNAIKFTESGSIALRAEVYSRDSHLSKVDLRIEVEDTGIGIEANELSMIFEDFNQVTGQDTAKYGGTGLGLSISQRLVELMGGTIYVSSQVGVGTKFTLYLRNIVISSLASDDDYQEQQTEIIFKPATILIVDDIERNRDLVRESFANTAVTIKEAANGQEAIDSVQKEMPDLILMDLRMPVMSGDKAAEIIKDKGFNIPILALTASVMRDDLKLLRDKVFDDFLRKPVKKKELFSQIATYLPHQRVDKHEEAEKIILTAEEHQALFQVLSKLEPLLGDWQQVRDENNISEIKLFAARLQQVSDAFKFSPINEYSRELNLNIETFDIKGINTSLSRFNDLYQDLLAISAS